jgi:hypothetical protein
MKGKLRMSDIYNNDVTYDIKWDTKENLKALKEVERKYFHRSVCYPSCPTAWAPEVLEMLDYLDKEFGIMWNEQTIMAYQPQGKWYFLFTVEPILNVLRAIKSNFLRFKFKEEWDREHYKKKTFKKRVSSVVNSFLHAYTYGHNVFRVQVVAPIVNKIRKPKIQLSQLKEKYGRLELYFSAPDYLESHIEDVIAKAKVKIALKGAYYPLETLYNGGWCSYVGNGLHNIDDIDVKLQNDGTKVVTRYIYRKVMKDLGVDLEEMALKATALEKKQDEQQDSSGAERADQALS